NVPGVAERGVGRIVQRAAGGLADGHEHEQRENDAGRTERDEGPAPADAVDEQAADVDPEKNADRHAEREKSDRRGTIGFSEVVADQRMRRGARAGLADADADAEQEELREARRGAAQRGHAAPYRDDPGEDRRAAALVEQTRDRKAERRVERGERDAHDESDHRVGDLELGLDPAGEDGDGGAVHKVDRVDCDQDEQHVVAIESGIVGPWIVRHRFSPSGAGARTLEARARLRGLSSVAERYAFTNAESRTNAGRARVEGWLGPAHGLSSRGSGGASRAVRGRSPATFRSGERAVAKEHIRHWRIGDVQVTRIVGVNAHEEPFTLLWTECGPDMGKHYPWLAPHFVTPDGRMKISFQAFALKTP